MKSETRFLCEAAWHLLTPVALKIEADEQYNSWQRRRRLSEVADVTSRGFSKVGSVVDRETDMFCVVGDVGNSRQNCTTTYRH
jgi:hypothetical protein